jgi:hypothetical protein
MVAAKRHLMRKKLNSRLAGEDVIDAGEFLGG